MVLTSANITPRADVYNYARAVTPSDSVDFVDGPCDGLYIGGGSGTIVLVFTDNTTATFAGVQTGSILKFRAKRVNSTGTNATNILACY